MARDYAKRADKKSSRSPRKQAGKRRSVGPWAWLLTGLLLGLLIGAVVYLKITMLPSGPKENPPKQAAKDKEKTAKKVPAPVVAKAPTPKFDFYTLLPEMEVAVAEVVAPKPKPPVQEATPMLPHPLEQAQYRLQLASYKRHTEADGLKAKLAMSGHVVEIHSVKLENGQVWYRVYTPVLPTRDAALTLQKELQNQAISSMLLRDREG